MNAHGAFQYAARHNILTEVTRHMSIAKNMKKWTHELVFQEAKKYTLKTHFKDHSSGAFNYAKRKGIFAEACAHMVSTARNGYSKNSENSPS